MKKFFATFVMFFWFCLGVFAQTDLKATWILDPTTPASAVNHIAVGWYYWDSTINPIPMLLPTFPGVIRNTDGKIIMTGGEQYGENGFKPTPPPPPSFVLWSAKQRFYRDPATGKLTQAILHPGAIAQCVISISEVPTPYVSNPPHSTITSSAGYFIIDSSNPNLPQPIPMPQAVRQPLSTSPLATLQPPASVTVVAASNP